MQELFAVSTQPQDVEEDSVKEILKNKKEIDELITQAAPEWDIDKINKVDLSVLRLATYELVFEHTQPAKVIIDEAIELAKEFGGESSPTFVNGALAKILVNPARTLRLIADKLGVEKPARECVFSTDLNASELEVNDFITSLFHDLNLTYDKKFNTVGELLDYIEDNA